MRVMFSYRSTDAEFVVRLAEHLRKHDIQPWIDREGIKPGTKWRDVLLDQLRTCDACIVILSPEYLKSEHCRMEVFIARSFGRLILPVMLTDCWTGLREYEETRGLENIFMMRMHRLTAVGLPIGADEAFEHIVDSIVAERKQPSSAKPVYISYSTGDASFASELARPLEERGVPTWIATLSIAVGENWRDAQARAMLQSSAHVVVLDENIVQQPVLRTEIPLAEARALPVFTVLPPRLHDDHSTVAGLMTSLNSSDQTYRRLAETQFFTSQTGAANIADELAAMLRQVSG